MDHKPNKFNIMSIYNCILLYSYFSKVSYNTYYMNYTANSLIPLSLGRN